MKEFVVDKCIKIKNLVFKACYLLNLRYTIRTNENLEGFNVFGYVSKILGQGEVVRAFVDDLIVADENFALLDIVNYNHNNISIDEESKYLKFYTKNLKYKNNVFFVDLMMLPKIRRVVPSLFNGKHNITVFWWEFDTGFEDRVAILNEFDEIYVFSNFIKNVLEKVENRNFIISKINYPFKKNWLIEGDKDQIRNKFKIYGKFCFFFNMDYRSSYNRKNPEAIVTALYEEFQNDDNVILVIKTNNDYGFSDKENKLKRFINDKALENKVLLVKESLTRNSFMSLLNSMDCYISLHRGEGLGLGILEALALEIPVIATNYGGNTEYMHHNLAYPVKYTIIAADDDFTAYKNVKYWAEPDIVDARRCMREVYSKSCMKNHEYLP